MSKELLLVAEAVANEKGVGRDVIFDALEAALASAAKKRYLDEDAMMRVSINRSNGSYETFRRWEVVADDVVMESPYHQLRLMDATDIKPDAQVGDFIEEPVENAEFGRISAQAAKQVIVQRVREAERAQVVDASVPTPAQQPQFGQMPLIALNIVLASRGRRVCGAGAGSRRCRPDRARCQRDSGDGYPAH